eukprot:TRINITY_DN659_c1_g1_i1.p1 TRINITY_DN659_c1_g1~~TRINITY_DN659_c1_g1_i1.p1  ORF type:complete len:315 (+),score=75.72 TRINITY_DN659_c1_g1_i1:40-984(+)
MNKLVSVSRHIPSLHPFGKLHLVNPIQRSCPFQEASQHSHRLFSSQKNLKMTTYSNRVVGQPETTDYRVFFQDHSGNPISPFHDIPLWADEKKGIANFILEIPLGTQPKLEISKADYMNPIKQDIKNGKLRNVAYKYPFNYGAFPQTWENPSFVHPDTNAKGDKDPLDVVELSEKPGKTGEVRQVKILGTYAMIDEGETDWKIIAIDVTDPNASRLNDISDIETVLPGKMTKVFEFLRDYKIPDGKPANQFAYNGELKNRAFAMKIIEENHHEWKKLLTEGHPEISSHHTVGESKFKVLVHDVMAKLGLGHHKA